MPGQDELNRETDPDKTKGEDKSVPLAALESERAKRQALEREVAEIRGHLKGLQGAQPPKGQDEQKPLSNAELRKAVDDGRITQAEADDLRERQLENRIVGKVKESVDSSLSAHSSSTTIASELARYKDAVPDLADRESKAFQKAQAEFNYLVDTLDEDPNDPRTELKAARAAFGPVDKLEPVRPRDRETYSETGGHGDGGERDFRQDGAPKGMTNEARAHYAKMIDMGIYKGWKDPVLLKEVTDFGDRARKGRSRAA